MTIDDILVTLRHIKYPTLIGVGAALGVFKGAEYLTFDLTIQSTATILSYLTAFGVTFWYQENYSNWVDYELDNLIYRQEGISKKEKKLP